MGPQQRLFLECAWTALEHAGYDPDQYAKSIAVFAGSSQNTYAMYNLATNRDLITRSGEFQTKLGNEKDFLTTRVSYKLNLRGPGVTMQMACSTSLVAVHMACQSLLNCECDIALAGGVTVNTEQYKGYLYHQDDIESSDGHCKAFFGWKWPGGSCRVCLFYWPWPGNTGQNALVLHRNPNNPRRWPRRECEKPHAHLRLHNACVVNRADTQIMSHLVLTIAIIAVKSDKEPIFERRENEAMFDKAFPRFYEATPVVSE
jgi:hypothetical protein